MVESVATVPYSDHVFAIALKIVTIEWKTSPERSSNHFLQARGQPLLCWSEWSYYQLNTVVYRNFEYPARMTVLRWRQQQSRPARRDVSDLLVEDSPHVGGHAWLELCLNARRNYGPYSKVHTAQHWRTNLLITCATDVFRIMERGPHEDSGIHLCF